METRTFHRFYPFFGLLLFAVALMVLHHELRIYHLHDILWQLKKIPVFRFLLALVLTSLSYVIMTGYDALALKYIQHPLPYGKIALASFTGYAFSNNIGLSMVAGGSVRYRLYSSWGLSVLEITKVVAFCTLSLWIGFFTLGGIAFVLEPMAIPGALHLPFVSARPLGILFLALICMYLFLILFRKKPFKFLDWEFALPPSGLVFSQLVVALLDWALAGTVLYVLLPHSFNLSWSGFLGVFLLAQLAGLASQLPGGLGVFETVVVLLLSPKIPTSLILGSLLAYRGIYYIFPLLSAVLLLGAQELFQKKETVKEMVQIFGSWMSAAVPPVFAFSTFVGGAILLFSGVTPSVYWRIAWLNDFLPLPIMEISHFLGSLVGAMLILLAGGLQRRIDSAYILTAFLLGAGVLFSLLKGFDYEEALILSVMLVALLPCRRYFYRKGALINAKYRPGWIAAIILVLCCSVWLGFFSFKHIEYSNDLWWRFALHSDASRFMRATVGTFGIALIFMTAKLISPCSPKRALYQNSDLNSAVPIVLASPKSYADLALLGDKSFLFSQKRNSFIMYAVKGRSWIAMGDPIGPKEEWPELIWRFCEMCDRYNGWAVFYEVGVEKLHLYLDLGLTPLKLGEEGRVSLGDFSLEGGSRKGLRNTCHRLEKDGCVFEIIPPERIPDCLPEFKVISEAWLEEKNTREKRFSLGFFDEGYLRRFPAGIVRKGGKVLGFANVLFGADKQELSIDLMRYLPESPRGIMEYIFIQLMLWGRQEGYQWFSLGMAPFSGFEAHRLAPLWSRLGAFVFRHGEHFYNLQGLRNYKEKFDPLWEPKYLAAPGGFALPRILTNIASLISGGMKGIITK
jgi:phosphatidylglycerol lysyltransferase